MHRPGKHGARVESKEKLKDHVGRRVPSVEKCTRVHTWIKGCLCLHIFGRSHSSHVHGSDFWGLAIPLCLNQATPLRHINLEVVDKSPYPWVKSRTQESTSCVPFGFWPHTCPHGTCVFRLRRMPLVCGLPKGWLGGSPADPPCWAQTREFRGLYLPASRAPGRTLP